MIKLAYVQKKDGEFFFEATYSANYAGARARE